jgi:outer membrane protein TolC
MVSVGVSVPLPWDRANRQDREVASKLAMAEQARAQREEMLRAHVGEVRGMMAEWRNGRERLVRYKNDLLPLAAERSKAALAGYQGGKAGITDLLLARRSETDMQLQAVQLEMDTARVWAQLNFLIPADAMHTGAQR